MIQGLGATTCTVSPAPEMSFPSEQESKIYQLDTCKSALHMQTPSLSNDKTSHC